MSEYINRNELVANLDKFAPEHLTPLIRTLIEKQPTADVVEVKHGEWKRGIPYVCSICGDPASDERNTSERYSCWLSPYCPHCGAKMDVSKMEITTEGKDT